MIILDLTITPLSLHFLWTTKGFSIMMQIGKEVQLIGRPTQWHRVMILGSNSVWLCALYIRFLVDLIDLTNPLRSAGTVADRTWLDSGSAWLKISPFGFRKILNFIKEEYGNPPIIITENGISERGQVDLNDSQRSYYYEKYLNQVLKGIKANISTVSVVNWLQF